MPEHWQKYSFVCKELEIISADLFDLATQSDQQITLAEAKTAHTHLNSILKQLILATRVSGAAYLGQEELTPSTPAPSPAPTCQ